MTIFRVTGLVRVSEAPELAPPETLFALPAQDVPATHNFSMLRTVAAGAIEVITLPAATTYARAIVKVVSGTGNGIVSSLSSTITIPSGGIAVISRVVTFAPFTLTAPPGSEMVFEIGMAFYT